VTKKFRLVFLATVILTGACGVGMGVLALVPNPSPQLTSLFDTLRLAFSGGVFTVFGLLGSSRQPDPQ
jgi:hypothetical protein